MLQSLMHIRTNADGVLNRRTFLRNVAIGAVGAGLLGWKDAVALHADELRKRGMACILLFMRGGPSQLETFDPKPGTDHGGPTKSISTAVSGIHIAEGWTKVAEAMKDITLIRSMTNREGEHARATYQLHTGYIPSGTVKYPSIGSIVASEIGSSDFDLPHFVSIADSGGKTRVEEHQGLYGSASQMVLSPRLKAFDITQEKTEVRDRYGRTAFGQGCLLARRLVESGVTFVEVELNGWDTHQDNFERVKKLSESADPAFAGLITDLKERGMLDKTLVIWMGEFGRTPKINPRTGRDHFPMVFNVALAGGGIKGGKVIGTTSPDAMTVKERPVSVPDLFCSFYQALKINPRKENMSSLGRPIKLIDGGKPVPELFA